MDRLMLFPIARRLRGGATTSRRRFEFTNHGSATSSSSMDHNNNSAKRHHTALAAAVPKTTESEQGRSFKLWSVLEDEETTTSTKRFSEEGATTSTDRRAKLLDSLQSSPSIPHLDRTWREFFAHYSSSYSSEDKTRALYHRSLAISNLVSNSQDMNRSLGAMHRVLHDSAGITKEEHLQMVNTVAKAFLKAEDGSQSLRLIQQLRREQGLLFPNRRTYALALASILAPQSKLSASYGSHVPQVLLPHGKESALKKSLMYFKSVFATSSPSSSVVASSPVKSNEELDTIFSVLQMLKEDYDYGNAEANLTQELFDEVLVLLPQMSAQIAEVMVQSGFQPSPTTFLAMLHSAMKHADANKALQLMSAMLDQDIERERYHYIATASALTARARLDRTKSHKKSMIRPWYFQALVDGYLKDFKKMDGDFAEVVLTGMCLARAGDQESVPAIFKFALDLAAEKVVLSDSVMGMLLQKLAVTNGTEHVKMVVEWMKATGMERGVSCDVGFLRYYVEQGVKLQRSLNRSKKNTEKLAELKATESMAEGLVQDSLRRRRAGKTLQILEESANHLHEGGGVVLSYSEIPPSSATTTSEMSNETIHLLAKMYMVTLNSDKLERLLRELEQDEQMDTKPVFDMLIRTLGHEKKTDRGIEVVADMQSKGIALDGETVNCLVVDCLLRATDYDRLGEAVAHALGLCRTYKIRPKSHTLVTLLEKARAANNTEEEGRILDMFSEFGLENDLKRKALQGDL